MDGEENKSFEFSEWTVRVHDRSMRYVIVYRPPCSSLYLVSTSLFFDEFSQFLEMESPRVVVWGLFYSLSTSRASSTLFLSISLPSMAMLMTPRFTSPSDLALSIPKLTLSLRLRRALLMFVLGLLLIV